MVSCTVSIPHAEKRLVVCIALERKARALVAHGEFVLLLVILYKRLRLVGVVNLCNLTIWLSCRDIFFVQETILTVMGRN